MMSQRGFASLQIFSKRQGSGAISVQDTTALASVGISPFHDLPLSFAVTVPAAYEKERGSHGHLGAEDVLLGARYRLDLTSLQQAFGAEGNFLMAVAGIELPTGTVHHDPFDRPPSYVSALFGSLERGPISAMAFGFGSLRAAGAGGSREGHEIFAGGGVAYTPIDSGNRLVSFQLGASYEYLFAARMAGDVVSDGGEQVMLTPTIVAGLSQHWQIFAMGAVPVHQGRTGPENRDRWRVGTGVVYAFGHEHP